MFCFKKTALSLLMGICFIVMNPLFAIDQMDFFGITVRWQGEDYIHEAQIKKLLVKLSEESKHYFDPDCRWRPLNEFGLCENKFPQQVQEITQLAEEYRQETLGFFDVLYNKKTGTTAKRDFGGLWQGYSLQKIKEVISGKWILDFSGDIYTSELPCTENQITITDPVFDAINYVFVNINRGYVMASVAKDLGGKIQVPNAISDATVEDDPNFILKVVLFAAPTFEGARLDAWTTAIIAGGKKVIDHLWELPEYRNQWAYFYFNSEGTPICSKNIECNFAGKNRSVRVKF